MSSDTTRTRGEDGLTDALRILLPHVRFGLSNKKLCAATGLSETTVKARLQRLRQHYGVETRAELAAAICGHDGPDSKPRVVILPAPIGRPRLPVVVDPTETEYLRLRAFRLAEALHELRVAADELAEHCKRWVGRETTEAWRLAERKAARLLQQENFVTGLHGAENPVNLHTLIEEQRDGKEEGSGIMA